MAKTFNVKSFAIASLRRASYRLISRNEALKAAKIARNQYVCNICKKVFGRSEVQLDHVVPIVDPVKGWIGFDDFINRLFVTDKNGFQVLCKEDHKKKTQNENLIRKFHDKARKRKSTNKKN